jgi:hypothetical protein
VGIALHCVNSVHEYGNQSYFYFIFSLIIFHSTVCFRLGDTLESEGVYLYYCFEVCAGVRCFIFLEIHRNERIRVGRSFSRSLINS